MPQADKEIALRGVLCCRLHRGRFGGRLGGLVDELHPLLCPLGRTGKAGVTGEATGHLLHHGLQGVELVGVQCAGELRNALLIELHKAAVELVGAVLELEHTLKEGSDDDDLAAADAEELDDSDDFSDDYSDEDMD